jgi:hypothetical protein
VLAAAVEAGTFIPPQPRPGLIPISPADGPIVEVDQAAGRMVLATTPVTEGLAVGDTIVMQPGQGLDEQLAAAFLLAQSEA